MDADTYAASLSIRIRDLEWRVVKLATAYVEDPTEAAHAALIYAVLDLKEARRVKAA